MQACFVAGGPIQASQLLFKTKGEYAIYGFIAFSQRQFARQVLQPALAAVVASVSTGSARLVRQWTWPWRNVASESGFLLDADGSAFNTNKLVHKGALRKHSRPDVAHTWPWVSLYDNVYFVSQVAQHTRGLAKPVLLGLHKT